MGGYGDNDLTLATHTSIESESSFDRFIDQIKKKTQDSGTSATTRGESKDRVNLKNWSVEVIVEWLEFKGLNQYSEMFRENRIDGVSTINLKEKDLLDMGITSKGHRMILREAIEKLKEKSMPTKVRKLSLHKGSQKKPCSLNSEMKLRQYYNTVVVIDEVESSKSSGKSSNSYKGSRVKSTSAKIELGSRGEKMTGESARSHSVGKNSIDVDHRMVLGRTTSAAPKDFTRDNVFFNGETAARIKKENSSRRLTPKSPSNVRPQKVTKKYSVDYNLDGKSDDESAVMLDSKTSAKRVDNEVPESVIARQTDSSDSVASS